MNKLLKFCKDNDIALAGYFNNKTDNIGLTFTKRSYEERLSCSCCASYERLYDTNFDFEENCIIWLCDMFKISDIKINPFIKERFEHYGLFGHGVSCNFRTDRKINEDAFKECDTEVKPLAWLHDETTD